MIKRQFFRIEHPDDNDDASDDSSSSSDDECAPIHEPDEDQEEAAAVEPEESPDSGYQSEDSSDSGEEFDAAEGAAKGKLTNDDNEEFEPLPDRLKQDKTIDLVNNRVNKAIESAQSKYSNQWAEAVDETERECALDDLDDCVIQCKSVFRCKLCPRIICLNIDTMKLHVDSKRHARSRKLFAEGRLKFMLNSDGEVEEEAETHTERHARIVASVEHAKNSRKRGKGRQRQQQRKKKKISNIGKVEAKVKQSSEISKKKRKAGKDEHHKS